MTTTKIELVPKEPDDVLTDGADIGRRDLAVLQAELEAAFPERHDVIESLLAALVARQHVLLLGPPGVAKSALTRAMCTALGGSFFDLLFTEFTDPSEVFGPFSMQGLQADEYRRVTTFRLPEADIAFLDEAFKANSAILNTLLTILNERAFHNGGKLQPVPLRMMIAASNEVPEEGGPLDAFADRILVRQFVHDIEDDGVFASVMWDVLPAVTARVNADDVEALHLESQKINATPTAREAIAKIRTDAKKAGLRISPRRWRQAASLLRARAALAGRAEVTTASLMSLVDVMWAKQEQIKTAHDIVEKYAATWMRQVQEIRKKLDAEKTVVTQTMANNAISNEQKFSSVGGVLDRLTSIAKEIAGLIADSDAVGEGRKLAALEATIRNDAIKIIRGGA